MNEISPSLQFDILVISIIEYDSFCNQKAVIEYQDLVVHDIPNVMGECRTCRVIFQA